jgi:hypothetical protein
VGRIYPQPLPANRRGNKRETSGPRPPPCLHRLQDNKTKFTRTGSKAHRIPKPDRNPPRLANAHRNAKLAALYPPPEETLIYPPTTSACPRGRFFAPLNRQQNHLIAFTCADVNLPKCAIRVWMPLRREKQARIRKIIK